ncbi:solute carrier family 5 member 3a [Denticeps clupeoides]|uniref:Sodium/myo-inositol cotransporter n=1 Tax=Denticeps clupeoides TaxID=299321 RepID=A0AAY4DXF3_9TELE|nr:sodium/myo-inositol cotransporter-like [Denticeps clupeoides]XP_028836748.1 sodium/myo-inositol cotransporter-like [Denticeps clupeoides]
MADMEVADIVVVALYFILVLGFGLFSMWKANRSTVSGYFLAGRSMNWFVIGASLFVSNIGSEHFIGLAGSGATSGFAVAAWEFNAILILQVLGWVFIPVYIHSGVYTMPEYLSKRFGGQRIKVYFAALSLPLYIFTKLSVDLYSGALFIQESLGWNLYVSIVLLISMTALLTITGGLVTVIYTDTLQAFLMIAGALILAAFSLLKVGGLSGLRERYMEARPNVTAITLMFNISYSPFCNIDPKPESFKILRGPLDKDLPWPGFLLGQTPASIWYWCADQVIVQRVLAAKNVAHAKGSTLMAGFLKILPMFIIVIPGMISRILYPDAVACIDPEHCKSVCGSHSGCSNIAYPRLVKELMPVGLRGLMMAVMIAALMSDLDSIFNSASTIFTLDIYKMFRQRASSKELMIVGRLFVAFMVVISIAWVPVIIAMQGGQMFLYIQEVSDYLTPPVAAMFLLGVFWKRCNESGAFWGGIVGLVLGALRLILAFVYREPPCNEPDNRPTFIRDVHFMYVAAGLFWISCLVTVFVSLCTPPPGKEQTLTTTIWRCKDCKPPLQTRASNHPTAETSVALNLLIANDISHDTDNHLTVQSHKGLSLNRNTHLESPTDASDNEETAGEGQDGKCMKILEWFCGFKQEEAKIQKKPLEEDKEPILAMLHEPPRTKAILNIGLILVYSLGIFLFVYFSL